MSTPSGAIVAMIPWTEVGTVAAQVALFALLGIALFAVAFWTITKLSPFSVRKEIEEDQNVALAIVVAAVILGIAGIVGASILG